MRISQRLQLMRVGGASSLPHTLESCTLVNQPVSRSFPSSTVDVGLFTVISGRICFLLLVFSVITLFYRAMLCIRGTSHGPVSVCPPVRLSVTRRCSTKTAKRRIT